MTAEFPVVAPPAPRRRSARNEPRVPCPAEGCTYSAEPGSSIAGHVAMAHPDIPMDAVAPKRPAVRRDVASVDADPHGEPTLLEAPAIAPSAWAVLTEVAGAVAAVTSLPIDEIVVEDNVREDLGDLEGLVASIREHGLLQAVLVDRAGDGWRLVDGHRRLEACRLAGLAWIPVQVAPMAYDGGARTTVQIVANTHRRDLGAVEEARGYRAVMAAEGIPQAELARRLSKDPSTISNALRLLEAAPKVQELVASGALTAAHAKAVLGLPPDEQERLAEQAVERNSSAHQLESDARYVKQLEADRKAKTKANAAALKHAIAALTEAALPAGTPVVVSVPWDLDGNGIREAIEEAGWRVLEGWGQAVDDCGCTTRRLVINAGKSASVEAICLDDDHRKAREAARTAKQREKLERDALEEQLLRGALETALARVSPTLLRVLLRKLEDYSGQTWTEYGKASNAAVVADLAHRVARSYGSKPMPVDKVVEALKAEAVL